MQKGVGLLTRIGAAVVFFGVEFALLCILLPRDIVRLNSDFGIVAAFLPVLSVAVVGGFGFLVMRVCDGLATLLRDQV